MGMFTQLRHDGAVYQFKTGWDNLETYQLGDTIPWTPDENSPGEHIDGVYDAVNGDSTVWVVVKGCTIVAVLPLDAGSDVDLSMQYGIAEPDRSLWSGLSWARKALREARAEYDYQKYISENPGGSPYSYFVHCKLNETPFLNRILPAKPAVAAHTMGPWHVVQTPGNSRLTIHGEVYDVATTGHVGSDEREKANAQLIAEAPELLEQLRRLVDVFDKELDDIHEFAQPLVAQARATIKKARGSP